MYTVRITAFVEENSEGHHAAIIKNEWYFINI